MLNIWHWLHFNFGSHFRKWSCLSEDAWFTTKLPAQRLKMVSLKCFCEIACICNTFVILFLLIAQFPILSVERPARVSSQWNLLTGGTARAAANGHRPTASIESMLFRRSSFCLSACVHTAFARCRKWQVCSWHESRWERSLSVTLLHVSERCNSLCVTHRDFLTFVISTRVSNLWFNHQELMVKTCCAWIKESRGGFILGEQQ